MGTLNIDAPLELTMYDNDGHYAYAQGTLKSEKALHKPMDEKDFATSFQNSEVHRLNVTI